MECKACFRGLESPLACIPYLLRKYKFDWPIHSRNKDFRTCDLSVAFVTPKAAYAWRTCKCPELKKGDQILHSSANELQRQTDLELEGLHEDREVPSGSDSSELAQRLEEAQGKLKHVKMQMLKGEGILNALEEAEADVKRKLDDAGYFALL